MPIGSSLGITYPVQGGNTGTWGTDLNAILTTIATAIEAQVPASAIDFSADLDMNDNGFTSTKMVAFDQQATAITNLNSLYFDNTGELYARDGANNLIQMTDSGALNNASAGGIGTTGSPAYGTSGVTFLWDGTNYNAKNGAGADDYAPLRCDQVLLRDGSGNDLTLAVAAMGGNYTFGFPTAVAGANGTFLQGTTGGVASWSNSTGTDITLTGTAEVKHGTRVLHLAGNDWSGETSWTYSSVGLCVNGATGTHNSLNIPLDEGEQITNINVYASQSLAGTLTLGLYTVDDTGALVGPIQTDTATGTGTNSLSLTALTETLANGTTHFLRVTSSGSGVVTTGNTYVSYNRP